MRNNNKGFTVVEFLVAALLAGIVTSAALSVYLTQHKQLFVQEEVSDMQSSLRAAMGELASRVRMIGYRLPEGLPAVVARNSNPDTIKILFDTNELGDIQIEHAMPTPSAELRCDGHDLTGINEGDTLYIYDPFTMTGEFFIVTEVQLESSHIQHNTNTLSHCYPRGSTIVKLQSVTYYIDTTDPDHPMFMYQFHDQPTQIYAENITDLNLQYVLSSGNTVDVPPVTHMIREVVISLSARSDRQDSEFQTPYRNRSLTTRIKVRNLGAN
jgi:Tfp pilus assembly protein PilW